MVTIREALSKGIEILKKAKIETPVVEAGVILCSVINCDKTFIYAHDDHKLSPEDYSLYLGYTGARAQGKPLQYITCRQEFMSLDFVVTPDVLIPRQDTEILVETVIKHINKVFSPPYGSPEELPVFRVLDLGTGSGCVAVSLAYHSVNCRVVAADISEKALEVARLNAVRTGTDKKLEFLHADIFGETTRFDAYGAFDAIVSNPPYIPSSHIAGLQGEVRDYEPTIALDGGTDGLDFYRRIIIDAAHHLLKPEGLLAFEVGLGQARDVSRLMNENYYGIEIYKDLAGIERVVAGKLKNGK